MYAAILWLCIALACAVFGMMLYSVVTYRGPQGKVRRHHVVVEVLWAAVPIAIIATAALPAVRSLILPIQPTVAASQE